MSSEKAEPSEVKPNPDTADKEDLADQATGENDTPHPPIFFDKKRSYAVGVIYV